jgi:hypothetical protein
MSCRSSTTNPESGNALSSPALTLLHRTAEIISMILTEFGFPDILMAVHSWFSLLFRRVRDRQC